MISVSIALMLFLMSTKFELAKQLKAIGKNVVVTATTVIASQGLRQKLPEHVGAVSTIHKFVGLKHGRFENDELLNLIVHDETALWYFRYIANIFLTLHKRL
jgi:hypothetical protein